MVGGALWGENKVLVGRVVWERRGGDGGGVGRNINKPGMQSMWKLIHILQLGFLLLLLEKVKKLILTPD